MEGEMGTPANVWKYARPEFERRYLLSQAPARLTAQRRHIVDRYFAQTQLRLRMVTSGAMCEYKLPRRCQIRGMALWPNHEHVSNGRCLHLPRGVARCRAAQDIQAATQEGHSCIVATGKLNSESWSVPTSNAQPGGN